MMTSWPVMYSEAGEARNRASGLMSSAQPTRCIGMSFASAACTAGLWAWPPPMFVTKNPGAIALTVMPDAASSSAIECIRGRAPAFAAM